MTKMNFQPTEYFNVAYWSLYIQVLNGKLILIEDFQTSIFILKKNRLNLVSGNDIK